MHLSYAGRPVRKLTGVSESCWGFHYFETSGKMKTDGKMLTYPMGEWREQHGDELLF